VNAPVSNTARPRSGLSRTVGLPDDLAARLRTAAEATGQSMRSITAVALSGYLDALFQRWDELSKDERVLIRAANARHEAKKYSRKKNKGGRRNAPRDARGRFLDGT
jgi:predicted transcriptional regulator